MTICDRYAGTQDDALEIMNDGFLKVFREIHNYKPAYADEIGSFKGWMRKIMVFTAIDHFRKHHKHRMVAGLDDVVYQIPAANESAIDKISHEEISKKLGISEGTSKSNLAKARKQLQKILFKQNEIQLSKNAV